jgi:hypothetical protein
MAITKIQRAFICEVKRYKEIGYREKEKYFIPYPNNKINKSFARIHKLNIDKICNFVKELKK